jgi:hypothetical protein
MPARLARATRIVNLCCEPPGADAAVARQLRALATIGVDRADK